MSTTVEAAPRAARALPTPRRTSIALAAVEGMRIVRHPIFIAGTLASIVILVRLTWHQAPVLQVDDVLAGMGLLPLAGVTLLVTNLAALRARRHHTEELFDSTPTRRDARTAALLFSVGWAVLVSVLLLAADMIYLRALGGVGSPNAAELLVGPALVALAGMAGIALARWVPTVAAGPLAVVGFAALEIILVLGQFTSLAARSGNLPRFAPWVRLGHRYQTPEVVFRRPASHLLYLGGITALLAAVAMLRHGSTRRRVSAAAVAVAVVAAGGWLQTAAPSRAELAAKVAFVRHPERVQICREISEVRYCAYRSYAPWIYRWAEVVGAVVKEVPASVRARGLRVVQKPSGSALDEKLLAAVSDLFPKTEDGTIPVWPDDGSVVTGLEWQRGPGLRIVELSLGLEAASWALKFPLGPTQIRHVVTAEEAAAQQPSPADLRPGTRVPKAGDVQTSIGNCLADGQARAVVAMWLAAQSTRGAATALRDAVAQDPYNFVQREGGPGPRRAVGAGTIWQFDIFDLTLTDPAITWGKAEANYALQLLDRPADEVAKDIRANWTALADPRTPTSEAFRLLHLKRFPTPEEQIRAAGLDPKTFSVNETLGPGSPRCP